MVTIVEYKQHENDKSEIFYSLILEGGIETVISKESGRPYLTVRRASITTTFNEEKCKELIGEKMPGSIRKEECEEYLYEIPDTTESVTLAHRYTYVPQTVSEEEAVFSEDEEIA